MSTLEAVRDEVRQLTRGRSREAMNVGDDMARLIRDNPDWRTEIAQAVREIVGDPIYEWQAAVWALRQAGIEPLG